MPRTNQNTPEPTGTHPVRAHIEPTAFRETPAKALSFPWWRPRRRSGSSFLMAFCSSKTGYLGTLSPTLVSNPLFLLNKHKPKHHSLNA